MRVLIIGADTAVGRSLEQCLLKYARHEVVALPVSACRWRSERLAKKTVRRSDCDIVVDTRIQAKLDSGTEINELDIYRNYWLARACQRNKVPHVYLSSSRVFAGTLNRRYSEDDYPDSEDSIGEMLLWAEEVVRDSCERHLILRLGPVFSHLGVNLLTRALLQLQQDDQLFLNHHLRGNPLASLDAARVLSGLLDQLSTGVELWGVYHYCSADTINCYEFVEGLLAVASGFPEFSHVDVALHRSAESDLILTRELDCLKILNTFAIKQMKWQDFLEESVQQYFESKH